MKKIDQVTLKKLRENGCRGELEKILVADNLSVDNLKISNCEFIGENKIYGGSLKNSTIENSTIFVNSEIENSIIINSIIGSGTSIENFSILKSTVTSGLKMGRETYPVSINNSQFDSDAILGGTDFRKTLSRGQSIFAFCHIGQGEFVRSLILGTPPEKLNGKTKVEIGHFGYYGDLAALSIGLKSNGQYESIDNEKFFDKLEKALKYIYFGDNLKQDFEIERGRSNFGAGTTVSNYDPIHKTKAGAIFFLASAGANVSVSPYLTVLPHSLIATASVDITRAKNTISENSLVIGARTGAVLKENYYDDLQTKIMNDRSKEEVEFLLRRLKLDLVLSELAGRGEKSENESERAAWNKAHKIVIASAENLAKENLPKYFDLLKISVDTVLKKIEQKGENSERLFGKMGKQKKTLENSKLILDEAQKIYQKIKSYEPK